MRNTLSTLQTMRKSIKKKERKKKGKLRKCIHISKTPQKYPQNNASPNPRPPGPMTCGKPEQPPNSTMVAANYNVDSEVEYRCDPGHVLIGPAQRTCLESGFFDEFPPTCRCESCCFFRGSSLGVMSFVKRMEIILS